MNINDKWSHYALVKKACLVLKFGGIGLPAAQPAYTEKCRFMDKRVREISRFFVAPRRAFPLSVWGARNHMRSHKFTLLSITEMLDISLFRLTHGTPMSLSEWENNATDTSLLASLT